MRLTISTPSRTSNSSVGRSWVSPMAPISVVSIPCDKCAASPASLIFAITFSTCWGVELGFMMINILAPFQFLLCSNQVRSESDGISQIDMGDFVLGQLCIPMDQHPDDTRQTVGHRDFARAEHGDESPAHLTGSLVGE